MDAENLKYVVGKAEEGQPDDMDFICESDGALMCYVTLSLIHI